jgi:hypothetical protein
MQNNVYKICTYDYENMCATVEMFNVDTISVVQQTVKC